MSNYEELFALHSGEGERFQIQLHDFIIENNLKLIVETGSGVSTLWILKALEKTGGKLYSIDTGPWCGYVVEHPQYEFIEGRSIDLLHKVYLLTGAWDLFLHDSNHDILCQTYEYEFAHLCVKQGGYITSDDVNWNNNKAWEDFMGRNKLTDFKIGAIQAVKKLYGNVLPDLEVERFSYDCLKFAKAKESEWLKQGNKNTGVFVY